jgi:hypothetical protein
VIERYQKAAHTPLNAFLCVEIFFCYFNCIENWLNCI